MSATTAPTPVPAVQFEPGLMRRKLTGTIFYGLCLAAVGILLLALCALLVDVLVRGLPWLDRDFLTGAPSRRPANAGILPALVGSIQVGIIVGVVTFPVGVAAAIYLNEYASDSWVNRLLQTNISNLAGVPSIIWGLMALGIFEPSYRFLFRRAPRTVRRGITSDGDGPGFAFTIEEIMPALKTQFATVKSSAFYRLASCW